MKSAIITGITGQDGSYLAEFLLNKGYEVHGIKRRSSQFNTTRIDHLMANDPPKSNRLHLHFGDLSDGLSLVRLIDEIQPDEIYNLGAQSHVQVSFENPEYTSDINGLGTLRLLEAIRILKLQSKVKFYQASTSEMFGKAQEIPQKESTPFYPRSPYGVAKLYAHYITINYREAYGIFASTGILFNHESPHRGETFAPRKITRGVARIVAGLEDCIYLGNLDAKRDWGHARDYVDGIWRILQHNQADDFILATGIMTSIRDFAVMAFGFAGIDICFEGKGVDEVGRCTQSGRVLVKINPRYFRPSEVDILQGDATKAMSILGWNPEISVAQLCEEMMKYDLAIETKMKPASDLAHHNPLLRVV